MPAASARSTGSLKAVGSTIATAMPSALAAMAAFIALTICPASLFSEPVHWYLQPSSAQASWMPYWVGTKKGFVVTWLTKTKFHWGCGGKLPSVLPDDVDVFADPEVVPLLPPPQAANNAGMERPPAAERPRNLRRPIGERRE